MVSNPEDYMVSFRKNLLTYINEKDISLADIAEAADMSSETLKTVIYGKAADVKLSTAVALAKALHLSVDELVGCETLSKPMRESISITRNLPDNFVSFVRWAIRFQERALLEKKVSKKAINVMLVECRNDGNLQITSNFDLMDISDLPDDKRYKIFMGIVIPCEHYMPTLLEGDILLLANDRLPLQGEMVVVVNNGFIRIVRRKEFKDDFGIKHVAYYSIHKGEFMAYADEVEEVIGYVAEIHRNNKYSDS